MWEPSTMKGKTLGELTTPVKCNSGVQLVSSFTSLFFSCKKHPGGKKKKKKKKHPGTILYLKHFLSKKILPSVTIIENTDWLVMH